MIQSSSQGQPQVQYISFKDLTQPSLQQLTLKNIIDGFQSKQWRKNFDTLTHLRQANKFYGNILLQQLLPQISQYIIMQIDNLRSNNSKQALTLISQIIQKQNIQKLQKNIISPIVSALFNKSTSQKAFLKKQAINAVQNIINKYNPYLLQEIANQILSLNSNISQLGAKILYDYIQNNKIVDINGQFLSLLIRTINGKRAVLQKKGKEILNNFKTRLGQQKLIQILQSSRKQQTITQDQYRALLEQIKKQDKQTKAPPSLKDYLKMKKKVDSQ